MKAGRRGGTTERVAAYAPSFPEVLILSYGAAMAGTLSKSFPCGAE